MYCPTRSARVAWTVCPVEMKPMAEYSSPIFIATVVFPVPGLPVKTWWRGGIVVFSPICLNHLSCKLKEEKRILLYLLSNLVGKHLSSVSPHFFFHLRMHACTCLNLFSKIITLLFLTGFKPTSWLSRSEIICNTSGSMKYLSAVATTLSPGSWSLKLQY